ncbi:hypothetical protein PAAG_12137 [Paracoccidioides lutzii Pb01]|uniref:Uncharacterized protein n=1 Tax=Paracoccidioides lutzii (strain ATCC MYA-826 / Pb01) TaxID=502779 RepID=A0A0A2V4E0_PARBA|nr:hypothetical protein PAAG_12137 [Paracoccidioides lutzii Pb01]KGQ01192.1 hypothetical protein PAAG_12137 [Paracoccidioides lutzii Pb01]
MSLVAFFPSGRIPQSVVVRLHAEPAIPFGSKLRVVLSNAHGGKGVLDPAAKDKPRTNFLNIRNEKILQVLTSPPSTGSGLSTGALYI